jgi:hypothetical protein
MIIEPYKSFGPLSFGVTNRDECIMLLGKPNNIRINREDVEEYHYTPMMILFPVRTRGACCMRMYSSSKDGCTYKQH